MLPINDEEEMFFKRIHSLKEGAINNYKVSTLKFLDLRKQEIIKYIIGNDCYLYFDGGYNDAEYKKCVISPFELDEPDFKITKLKLNYNKKYLELNHRKVLAVLMELGIKREVFGDILFNNNDVFIMASSENKDFIINNLRLISHQSVEVVEYDGELSNVLTLQTEKIFISSMRLDAIIAGVYNVARSISQDFIKAGNVKINQALIQNNNHECKPNDIVSVRGKGRFKIIEMLGKSKSERIVLEIGKYI
jgi:RNA-binding protein YlmH